MSFSVLSIALIALGSFCLAALGGMLSSEAGWSWMSIQAILFLASLSAIVLGLLLLVLAIKRREIGGDW